MDKTTKIFGNIAFWWGVFSSQGIQYDSRERNWEDLIILIVLGIFH